LTKFRTMTFHILGINHKSASLCLRERCATTSIPELEKLLSNFIQYTALTEVVFLSTCNRTEIFFNAENPSSANEWFIKEFKISGDDLKSIHTLSDVAAIEYGMRIAGGLESMVIGEPQILGQLKQAYKISQQNSYIKKNLENIFNILFHAGKSIRNNTDIGRCPLSLARTIVALAPKHLPNINSCKVLLIGAGEMNTMTAMYLHQSPLSSITITNRSFNKAEALANKFNAEALHLKDLPFFINDFDLIICATTSINYIIKNGMLRNDKQRLLIDLAIPRNIEPAINELPNISLYNHDDLAKLISNNLSNRQQAMQDAEAIISNLIASYTEQCKIRDIAPILQDYRARYEPVQQECIDAALAKFGHDPKLEQALKYMAHRLCSQIIHQPTKCIRDAAAANNDELLAAAYKLFDLQGS
jgi:glutamyl-tRNA reductase